MKERGRGAPSSGPNPRSRDGWMRAADGMDRWDGSMDGEPRTGDVERQNRATADGVRSRSVFWIPAETSRDLECLAREPAVTLLVVGGRVILITKERRKKREEQGTCFVENSEALSSLACKPRSLLRCQHLMRGLPAQNQPKTR